MHNMHRRIHTSSGRQLQAILPKPLFHASFRCTSAAFSETQSLPNQADSLHYILERLGGILVSFVGTKCAFPMHLALR